LQVFASADGRLGEFPRSSTHFSGWTPTPPRPILLAGRRHITPAPADESGRRLTMLGHIRGEVRFREPLSFHTSLRCGGPADILVVPVDLDDLRRALGYADREGLPVAVLGGGNSVLAGGAGFRGVAIKLEGAFARTEFHGDEVTAGAGVALPGLVREATARGLGGLECVAGVPGTLGGALATNAGGPESRIGDRVASVYFVGADGMIGEFRPAVSTFPYAAWVPPAGSVFVAARLSLCRRPAEAVREDVRRWVRRRGTCQPRGLASAGFIWKDPAGHSADALIRAAGLRGKRVGNAEVPAKHGNLIVSRGELAAGDVVALMDMTARRVFDRTGVRLERRIPILGR
jgi:UDP-N-acetylmuramate dehydrogenase